MKKLKIVVLAKQVPDTRNVGKDAMKADGTVNRGALPAIFNPEDMNALEQALQLKDKYPDTEITILTMGPGRAADIIREGLYRGVDNGILLTDRKFAGSDTLATSYALSLAIKKIVPNLIIAGRQAIDGDTAQVGPQVAEKLNIPQITYAESISYQNNNIIVKRRLDNGIETVQSPMPVLITVGSSATICRARNAKLLMKFKHACTQSELQEKSNDYIIKQRPYLKITEWGVDDVDADDKLLGLSGSPTKVKKIENVVFTAKESKIINDNDAEINELIIELIENHTIG
ncbi:MAG: electron transfer flavoprotein subunit beta/FixA family protein [Bacteroidales bacterium]|jgi:electron transfer flavoprotein beta subunit|nr:electron transfer flavoprotein subunit beta/FixA family protein [Bacteroidales bacterium]